MYALVIANSIQSVGNLPAAARRLDTGQWVCPPDRNWSPAEAAACGYLPVVDTARPADTVTDIYERSVQLVAGAPTVVWTARPKTAAEVAAATVSANDEMIRQQADAALTANATFIAIAAPTNAQNAAQIKALTRQVNKLIRLTIGRLDGTD